MNQGIIILFTPIILYFVSLPFSGRLWGRIKILYISIGGLTVFGGAGITLYLAFYTGDQGGIAAFFFQVFVIVMFFIEVLVASISTVIHKYSKEKKASKMAEPVAGGDAAR